MFLQVASIIVRCTSIDFNPKGDFPTFTIDLIIAMSIVGAIYQEYRRSAQSSAFLGLHLALGILIDSTRSRQYFTNENTQITGYLCAASAVVRVVLLLLDEIPRGAALVDGHIRRANSKESSGGFWNRALFLWLNSTFLLGFRGQLTPKDLDQIGPDFAPEELSQRFKQHWQNAAISPKWKLAAVCFRILLLPILALALPRLLFSVSSVAQPFLLQRLLIAIQSTDLTKYTEDSLALAFFLVFFTSAASRASFKHLGGQLMIQLRSILIAEVLDKSHTLAQPEAMKSAAMTLMTNDVEKIALGVTAVCEIPFHLTEVVLGMYCLGLFVGKACFVIMFPLLCSIAFGSYIAKHSGAPMAAWNEKIRHRVSETSRILSQLRVIKIIGLSPTISVYLQQLREGEIASAKMSFTLKVAEKAAGMFVPTITPVVVVAAGLFSTSLAGKLSPIQVFPCLAAVSHIQRPLYTLVPALSTAAAMFACMDRIQAYLELEEYEDHRILVQPPPLLDSKKEHEDLVSVAVEFVDVTLQSRDSESEIFRQANFSLDRGSITAALGPSGSGKSALLHSLVGDANVADGFIYVEEGVIGYADQSPWIQNVSVRENIVGRLVFDAEWYSTILSVCLLLEDLDHLPGHDNYVAGTNGMNLSGGQRHRISLARALYCRAPIVVLDDIFSALDRKTAVSILFLLCGEDGLLRNAGCTVIMATHLSEVLEVADQLLLLDGKGGLVLETDFEDEWFRATLVSALNSQTAKLALEIEGKEKSVMQLSRGFQDLAQTHTIMVPAPNRGFNTGLYAFFINTIGTGTFVAWVFVVFLVSLGETLPDIFIRIWIEVAPENINYLSMYVGASIFATTASAAANTVVSRVLAPRSSTELHARLTHTVMRSTLAFFSCTDTGSILNRYSQDMNATMQVVPWHAFRFFYMLFHVIIQAVIIASGTTYMVTILPFIILSVGVILFYYSQTSRQMRQMELETKTPLYNYFAETATGLRHIRALGLRPSNLSFGLELLYGSQKPVYIANSIKRWLSLVMDLLTCGVSVTLTSLSMRHRGTASIPAIGLSYLILLYLGISLEYFVENSTELDNSINALSRLRDFMDNTPTEPELDPIDLPPNWPHRGEIKLECVSAKYRIEAPLALQDVSLLVRPGDKVGITGRTGSGKSSLFLSMLGFLEYTGRIEIDGVDISTVPRDTLRSRIITISQDYLDLGGSVRNNLLPFNLNSPTGDSVTTDNDVDDVLRRVGLLTLVNREGGLEAQLSKVGLSHGQLQLLSIARAILRSKETRSKVILMDEATSNVDLETDTAIQKVLREAFAGCTIMMIAHRLETVKDANMLVELVHGKARVVDK